MAFAYMRSKWIPLTLLQHMKFDYSTTISLQQGSLDAGMPGLTVLELSFERRVSPCARPYCPTEPSQALLSLEAGMFEIRASGREETLLLSCLGKMKGDALACNQHPTTLLLCCSLLPGLATARTFMPCCPHACMQFEPLHE